MVVKYLYAMTSGSNEKMGDKETRISEIDLHRLYKTMDGLFDELKELKTTTTSQFSEIRSSLETIIKIEAKVGNHEETLARFGKRLDTTHERVHELELWRSKLDVLVERNSSLSSEVSDLKERIDSLESVYENRSGKEEGRAEVIAPWKNALFYVIAGVTTASVIFVLGLRGASKVAGS